MSGPDEDFDEFLKRRRPIFSRATEDSLEPPAELDRRVLRQAREAIRAEPPMTMYRGPRWGAPVAIAATLLVAFAVVLRVGVSPRQAARDVALKSVAQRIDSAATTPNNVADAAAPAETVSASTRAAAAPPPQPAAGAAERSPVSISAKPAGAKPWRRDSAAWLAEIDRLRASGEIARADAELTEYKREHRAYATSPNR